MGTDRDSEGPVERPCFDHPVLKHPEVRGHTRRRSNLVGNVCKTLQSTQPNRLAVSTVMDDLSQRNWSYLDFSTPLNIFDEGNY